MEAERQRREAEEREERQRREEEEREEARKAQIEALLAKARERREADDLEGTLTVARRVFALDAENPTAQALMEELEAERRRREKEAQRAEQLAAAIASIDACLDREDPEAASRLLPGIVAIFGDAPALRERWERIEDLRRGKVRERVDSLLAHARKLQAGGELEAALGGLREASSLLPTDPDVRSLAREVEGALRQRDEESRRVRELETALEAALVAIDEGLERGDLAGAARLLPAAVARFGGAPALRERWERLEALQRKARVEALRSEAESLARTGHLDRAVRKLRQALELDPGNRTLVDLLAELSRR
jgi:tetratricopeptide (TPR) repeat protein